MMVDETIPAAVSHLPPEAILPASCRSPCKSEKPRGAVISAFSTWFSTCEFPSGLCLVNLAGTHGSDHQFSGARSLRPAGSTRACLVRVKCYRLLLFTHIFFTLLESTLAIVGLWTRASVRAWGTPSLSLPYGRREHRPTFKRWSRLRFPNLDADCRPVMSKKRSDQRGIRSGGYVICPLLGFGVPWRTTLDCVAEWF